MLRFRLAVLVLSLSLLGAASFQKIDTKSKPDTGAKPEDKAPAKVKGHLPSYYKKLGLRDDQVQNIYRIRADYKVKIETLKQQMDRLKTEEKGALEKVLTPEQLKRLRELRSGEKAADQ